MKYINWTPAQSETVFEKILAVTYQELHVTLCLLRGSVFVCVCACVYVCVRTHVRACMRAHAHLDTPYSASYNLGK
jgi:hypothetical protein